MPLCRVRSRKRSWPALIGPNKTTNIESITRRLKMEIILGIGIGLVVFGYHTVVLVYAVRTRWIEERLRRYMR